MKHFQLRANGSNQQTEELELQGPNSFFVSPNAKNEFQYPIRGSVIVNILGKSYSIGLTHKSKEYKDPELSSTKWSYVENMYITGNTPVASADIKSQDTAYVRASRGKTVYTVDTNKVSTIIISKAYTTSPAVLDTVGDFSDPSVGTSYNKGAIMTLFTFTMYYKYSTDEGGTVIPPIDDGTPASNKARIPCRPDAEASPDWISNSSILYQVNFVRSGSSDSMMFGTWSDFIAFWDSIQTNPEYTDAVFHYIYKGTVDFNELIKSRGYSTITISEIDNGKGIGIHGAKPLYLIISQQEGKNTYGVSVMPAETSMLDGNGNWSFNDLTEYEIFSNKLASSNRDSNIVIKFRVDSREAYKAYPISLMTGSPIEVNQEEGGTSVNYQYIGQPFILKLYRETANGIEGIQMRPYYKKSNGLWSSYTDLIGHRSYNPLRLEGPHSSFDDLEYHIVMREGFQTFSGPMYGNHGSLIFQIIPLVVYKQDGTRYSPASNLANYSTRYLNYQSAIGITDRTIGAFLKWPNQDGNNEPDHIDTQGDPENVPSYMGKIWENLISKDTSFTNIDRVMFVPVLWCNKRLEDDSAFRTWLSEPRFSMLWLSPNISDSEIDQTPDIINGVTFTLNVEVRD